MCAQHEKEWWARHEEARVRHHAEGLAKLAADMKRDVEKPGWDALPLHTGTMRENTAQLLAKPEWDDM